MKRVIPLLFTMFLFVFSSFSIYSNDYTELKEKIEIDKSKIVELLPTHGSMLKSVSGSKIKLQTIEGEWGRKVFTYNDNDQIISYKYFKIDEYSNEEELTEQHTYEYNSEGGLVLSELYLLDSFYGWNLIEKEENSYYTDGRLKQSNVFSYDYSSGETESASRHEYEYSGNITQVNSFFKSGNEAEWVSMGYVVYEVNSQGLLVKTEVYEIDEDTGEVVLGSIFAMQYDAGGNEIVSVVSSPDEDEMVEIFRTETEYNPNGTIAQEQNLMLLYDAPMLLDKTMYYYQNGKLVKMEEYSMNYSTLDTYLNWYIEYGYVQGKLESETYYQSDGFSGDFTAVSKKEFAFGDLIALDNIAIPEIEEYESFYEFDLYDLDYYENGLLTELTLYTNNYDDDDLVFVKTSSYSYSSETSQLSDNATLSAIQIDGDELSVFDSGVYEYTIDLSSSTEVVPQISAFAVDEKAQVEITQAVEIPGTASILVTAEDGTTQTYTIIFNVESSLNEKILAKIKLFPNPVSHNLKIELEESIQLNTLTIYSSNGKRVKTDTGIQTVGDLLNIDVSHFEAGLFFVELCFDNGTKKTMKFSKY